MLNALIAPLVCLSLHLSAVRVFLMHPDQEKRYCGQSLGSSSLTLSNFVHFRFNTAVCLS